MALQLYMLRLAMANIKTNNVAIAATVMLASPVLLSVLSGECQAADFRHVKKIIVPASAIPRRYDYSSSGGTEAVPSSGSSYGGMSSSYNPSYGSSTSARFPSSDASSSSSSKPGKYGLVPPPPPVMPSLLPSTFASEVPASSYSGSNSGYGGSGRTAPTSSTTHSGYQRVSGDPARKSSFERNVQQSSSNKEAAETAVVGRITSQADTLIREGKLQEAQDLLEKYHHIYPKDTALTNKLSVVALDRAKYAMRHDDFVEGGKLARQAIAYDAHNSEAKTVLDQVLRHHGLDPKDGVNRIKMGDLLLSQGKMHEARVEYDAAAKSGTSSVHAQALIGLGNVAMRENKLKEAKAQYQLALEKAPNSHDAFRQMGLVRYKLKDVVGANADLSRALVLEQNDKLASQALIELWQRQVSANSKDANTHLGLARAYQLSGDLTQAQAEYRTVVNIDPNHPNLPAARQSFKLALARQEAMKHYEAAKTLDTQGALSEAFAKSAEAVKLSPGETKFRLYQAELAERLALYPDAKHLYLEVLRQDPKNILAAQRIKALSEMIAAEEVKHNLRGPIDMKANAGSLTPQAVTPPAMPNPASLLGTPRFKEGPALPTLPKAPGASTAAGPGPSPDPVQNMSGFLTSLRNYMFVQKKELQKQEDNVMEAIGATPKSSGSSLSKLSALGAAPAAVAPLDLPKGMISSADVSKLISGIKSTPTASATALKTAATETMPPTAPSRLSAIAGAPPSGVPSSYGAEPPVMPAPPPIFGQQQPVSDGQTFQVPPGYGQPQPVSSAMQLPPDYGRPQPVSETPQGLSAEAMEGSLPPLQPRALSTAPHTDPSAAALAAAAGYPEAASMVQQQSAPAIGSPRAEIPAVPTTGQLPGIPQVSGPTDLNSLAQSLNMNPADLAAMAQSFGIDPNNIPALAKQFGINANNIGAAASAAQQYGINPSNIGAVAQQYGINANNVGAAAQQIGTAAQQMGITPDKVAAAAKQAPALANKAMSNVKEEDLDKAYGLLKKHVALKQELKTAGGVPQTAPPIVRRAAAIPQTAPLRPSLANPGAPYGSAVSSTAVSSVSSNMLPNEIAPSTPAASTTGSTATDLVPTPTADKLNNNVIGSLEPPATPATSAATPAAAFSAPDANNRIGSLEAQNKELLAQLESTKQQLNELKQQNAKKPVKAVKEKTPKTKASKTSGSTKAGKSSATVDSAPTNPGDVNLERIPAHPIPTNEGAPDITGSAQPPAITGGAQSPLNSQTVNNIAAMAGIPMGTSVPTIEAAGDGVRLELAGVSVRPTGVRLNVVMRNTTEKELELPTTTKAIVRMVGIPDQTAKVKFPIKKLASGAEAKGFISVSGHKLDPSADVLIPNLVSSTTGPKDVHLTVPISALVGQPR